MRYYYKCKETTVGDDDKTGGGCKLSDLPQEFYDGTLKIEIALDSRSTKTTEDGEVDPSSTLVWTVNHSMSDSPDIICQLCGHKATRIIGKLSEFYFRGDGYLDKVGARRDMDLYKMNKDDPYGYMREPGEKDDLMDRLRRGGKHNPNPQYFRTSDKALPKPKPKKDPPPSKCTT